MDTKIHGILVFIQVSSTDKSYSKKIIVDYFVIFTIGKVHNAVK